MWRTIAPIGRGARSGGYFRQPFASAERELDAWFVEQAGAQGLRLETDPFGNRVAWWDPEVVPDVSAHQGPGSERKRQGLPVPGVVTGSHLDSVLDGGAYDGPLGVVSALAALEVLRDRGFRPARPIGVSVFAEEDAPRLVYADWLEDYGGESEHFRAEFIRLQVRRAALASGA